MTFSTQIKKRVFIALGSLFVGLGFAGVFLPLVPTTPFLIVAVFFYMHSSKRAMIWLLRNRYLSPYVYGYLSKKGMPIKVKHRTIAILWGTMLISILLINSVNVQILLIFIAALITLHIAYK